MKKLKFYQRKFIINKNLQLGLLLYSLILAAWMCLTNLILQSIALGKFGPVSNVNLFIFIPLVMTLVFSSTIFFGLVLTNRIAGPIYRLRRHMEDVADGKTVGEMKIRNADYFSDIISPYNRIVSKIRDLQEDK